MKNSTHLLLVKIFFSIVFLFFIGGCDGPQKDTGTILNSKKIVIKVNNSPIFEGDIVRRIESRHGETDKSKTDPIMWQRLYEAAAEEEIFETLLYDAALKEGLHVDPQKVNDAVAKSKKMMGQEQFAAMLKKQNSSEDEYTSFIQKRMLVAVYEEKLASTVKIDEEELKEYFTGHAADQLSPDKVRLEVFLLKDEKDALASFS